MAVDIKLIHCGESGSDEEKVSLELKDKFNEYFRGRNVSGSIFILTNVLLYGYANNEIDLVVLGTLSGLTDTIISKYKNGNGVVFDTPNRLNVDIRDFCFTIELKMHDPQYVKADVNKGIIVRYVGTNMPENASQQSRGQMTSLLKFLRSQLHGNVPSLVNLLWLYNVNNAAEINNLSTFNVLYGDFSIQELWSTSTKVSERFIPELIGNDNISCLLSAGGQSDNAVAEYIRFISQQPKIASTITRKRVEMITDDVLGIRLSQLDYDKGLLVFKGNAGTGKTSALLRIAYLLKEEQNARCLILTYNRALVGDIRRTFAFFQRDRRPDGKTISVSTMQKFFISLMHFYNNIEIPQIGKNYDNKYREGLSILREELKDKDSVELLKLECQDLYWDYILVDEGQDWLDEEKDIILSLFQNGHVIVADGGDQIVRPCNGLQDWIYGLKKDEYVKTLYKEGLRQKNNLMTFVNSYAEAVDYDWRVVQSKRSARGGVVKIYRTEDFVDDFKNQIEYIKGNLVSIGNEMYDMLMLVTPDYVQRGRFENANIRTALKECNLDYFDGVNPSDREDYPINQMRIFQYESCRGMEGWTVVCLDFDKFIERKINDYEDKPSKDVVDSYEDRLSYYVNSWSMMALTRPISELIITLSDPQGKTAEILYNIADRHPDIIQLNIE